MRRALWLCALASAAMTSMIVVAVPAGAGGGCHGGSAQGTTEGRVPAGRSGRAVIEGCAFSPTVVYADEGAEITWVNKDVFEHTITGAGLEWGSERFLRQGDTITQRFTDEGVFPFFCMLHPGMVGAVVVGDPDPSDVTTELAAITSTGIEPGGGQGAAQAPRVVEQPGSGAPTFPLLLGTIALLVAAGGVALTLVRRRTRVEQA